MFTLLCLFRLFFRSIPNLGLWQKTMTLFAGWVDQPGIFLLLDKPRRSHRQVIIFHLDIKLQSSQFLAIVRVVFFWFLFVHTVLEFRLPVLPLCCEFQISCSHLQRKWKICWPDKRMLQSTWTTSNTEEPTSAPTGWSTWTNQRWYSCRLSYTNRIILKQ